VEDEPNGRRYRVNKGRYLENNIHQGISRRIPGNMLIRSAWKGYFARELAYSMILGA